MKRLSFITQFKIEFLLPFTDCRKVLGKMFAIVVKKCFTYLHIWCIFLILPYFQGLSDLKKSHRTHIEGTSKRH